MTAAQKFHFYLPAWSACVKANGWHIKNKCAVVDEAQLTEEGRKVMTFARQRAMMQMRGPTLDDVRHGCHWLALGKDKSSEHLTNADVDRVVCLFHVLENPLFLGTDIKSGRLDWDAYQRGEDPGQLRRVQHVIRSVPEALARHIALDMIGTRDWENATLANKLILARRIAQYRDRKIASGGSGLGSGAKPQTPDARPQTRSGSYQLNPKKMFTPKPKPAAVLQPAGSEDSDWTV